MECTNCVPEVYALCAELSEQYNNVLCSDEMVGAILRSLKDEVWSEEDELEYLVGDMHGEIGYHDGKPHAFGGTPDEAGKLYIP